MGRLKKTKKGNGTFARNVVNVNEMAGVFSEEEKKKLLSGDGFVKVPTEELERIRVSSYAYLL